MLLEEEEEVVADAKERSPPLHGIAGPMELVAAVVVSVDWIWVRRTVSLAAAVGVVAAAAAAAAVVVSLAAAAVESLAAHW